MWITLSSYSVSLAYSIRELLRVLKINCCGLPTTVPVPKTITLTVLVQLYCAFKHLFR